MSVNFYDFHNKIKTEEMSAMCKKLLNNRNYK